MKNNRSLVSYCSRNAVLAFLLIAAMGYSAFAEGPHTSLVQKIETFEFGIENPEGIAFTRAGGCFVIAPRPNTDEVGILTQWGRTFRTAALSTAIPNPFNMAFDDRRNRLLFFDEETDQLVGIDMQANGGMDLSGPTVTHYDLKLFNPRDLLGMTMNPETGDLFFLVVPGSPEPARVIHLVPDSRGGLDGFAALRDDRVHEIILKSLPSSSRGIAFNPEDGHLYVMSPNEERLYEITGRGEMVSKRDVSVFELRNVQNMIFASSGDQTDEPSTQSLFITDRGERPGQGGIVELTLIRPMERGFSPMALDFTLVQNIHTWQWDPPSPDASGIAYIPSTGHLLVCDGEIDEDTWNPPLWGGYNVWEISLTNSPFGGWNTLDFNDEPTGVAYNPNNQHLYFSRDNSPKSIFEVDAGLDSLYGTNDDIVISNNVGSNYGSDDPEGVTYDTEQGHVFWVDGVNREVYDLDLGPDGMVGGGDDVLIHQFDTQSLGATDPEGVEFNPDNGHLYILGSNDIIIETTRNGTYIQEASIGSLSPSKPAGLAYAPTSNNPFAKSLYIVCRGTDNNGHPTENDGEIYEISLGSFIPTLSIDDVGVLEGDAGTVNAVFTVTLTSATADVVTVNYATADGSATTSDNDYVAKSGQVSFQPGETSQPISVMVNGDGVDEPDENFYVNLSNAVNAPISDDQGEGTILNDDGPQLITLSFQDGTNGYSDTRDTYIDGGGSNHGSEATLLIDGSPQYSTLLYWDVSVIPPGSMVQSVDIQVNVVDPTGDLYEVYELYRPWVEGEATWNQYATGQNWEIPGVLGSGDRGSTVLGDISSGLGLHTISLNAAGVAAVQAWIDDPSSNHGFIIQDYANTGGLDLSSRESGTASLRPMLTVSFYTPPPVLVELKVFLEGPYDATGDTMRTDLTIPTTSPYSEDPRTVSTIPQNITDWVLVELRETATGAEVAWRSALLRNDGHIVSDNGINEQISIVASEGNYYIVIRHRNHLAVMSMASVALSSGASTLYDFTIGTSQYYGSDARLLEAGVFGMYKGDANGNSFVNSADYLMVKGEIGSNGYYEGDCNLNAFVNSADYLNVKPNVGKSSQVP